MKSLLGLSDSATILIVLLVALMISIIICLILKRKFKDSPITENKNTPISNIEINNEFCNEDVMKFLENVHKALPRECIALPNVGVDRLVKPQNSKLQYNKILSKYVDVCVFSRKGMKPILVIDLIDNNPIKQELKKLDDNVLKTLEFVDLPIIQIKIEKKYNIDSLRVKLIDKMPKRFLAYIKDNLNNEISAKPKK